MTDHDAHAWVEVWFRGYGWLPFDPTPAARPGRGQLSAPYAAAVESVAAGTVGRLRAVGSGPTNLRQSGHRHGETPGTGVRGLGTPSRRGTAPSSHGSLLVLLALVLGGAVAAIAAAKLVVRRVPLPDARSAPRRRGVPPGARRLPRRPAHRRRAERDAATSSVRSCGTSCPSSRMHSSPRRPPRASGRRRDPQAPPARLAVSCAH